MEGISKLKKLSVVFKGALRIAYFRASKWAPTWYVLTPGGVYKNGVYSKGRTRWAWGCILGTQRVMPRGRYYGVGWMSKGVRIPKGKKLRPNVLDCTLLSKNSTFIIGVFCTPHYLNSCQKFDLLLSLRGFCKGFPIQIFTFYLKFMLDLLLRSQTCLIILYPSRFCGIS